MAATHSNLAVTKDGEIYNKLSRPADYLTSTTPLLPPLAPAVRPSAHSNKRKRGREITTKSDGAKRKKGGFSSSSLGDDAEVFHESGSTRSCGMRTILPGGDDDMELMGESMNEAMAYLRSVRCEASKIPPVLVAQTSDTINDTEDIALTRNDTGTEDGVFYKDGVWIAVDGGLQDGDGSAKPDVRHLPLQPQQSYYDLILVRFQILRTKLREAGFPCTNRTAPSPHRQPRSRQAWLDVIDINLPTSEYMGQLDEPGLFHALEACSASLGRSASISREKSCWIWTLLAMASDAGTMNSTLVGKIRYLGLQAARLGARLQQEASDQDIHSLDLGALEKGHTANDHQNHNMQEPDMEVEPKDNTVETEAIQHQLQTSRHYDRGQEQDISAIDKDLGAVPEDEHAQTLEQARAQLLAQLGDRLVPSDVSPQENKGVVTRGAEKRSLDDPIDWNTKATIDMILTVVAERYGQRDLLESRMAW